MPNYKKMYFTLFNAMSDVIQTLEKAQQQTEEMYINNSIKVKVRKTKNKPK